ncbi:MAG: hemolysin family protein [Firmicutes bacterium]|nr:hemolysin family protein [Bacillota bacterium]
MVSILFSLLVIIFLIAVTGFFVAAEFALLAVPRGIVNQLASEGNKAAKLLQAIARDPALQDKYVATSQTGITLASLGLGMYGETTAARWLEHYVHGIKFAGIDASHIIASVIAVGILTYFHIVLGEILPKSLALLNAEKAALMLAVPMKWVEIVIFPLVVILNAAGNGILRIFGIRRQMSTGHFYSTDELRFIVRESKDQGVFREESGKVIDRLFNFSEIDASEVMVPRVKIDGIPLNADSREISAIISRTMRTRYPVYRGNLDHIKGILHIKDILRILIEKRKLNENDLRTVPYVLGTFKLDEVLRIMKESKTQAAVVHDEYGGTAGFITVEDLFEEVVGNIEEFGEPAREIHKDSAGLYHVLGTTRLSKLEEELFVDFETPDIDSVSGFILDLLGRTAETGDKVSCKGYNFKVSAVDGRGVKECIITKDPEK